MDIVQAIRDNSDLTIKEKELLVALSKFLPANEKNIRHIFENVLHFSQEERELFFILLFLKISAAQRNDQKLIRKIGALEEKFLDKYI